MTSIETLSILCIALLASVCVLFSKLDQVNKRLSRIEGSVGTPPAEVIPPDAEVQELLNTGKTSQAIALYARRTMLPLRQAELQIHQIQATAAN